MCEVDVDRMARIAEHHSLRCARSAADDRVVAGAAFGPRLVYVPDIERIVEPRSDDAFDGELREDPRADLAKWSVPVFAPTTVPVLKVRLMGASASA